MGSAGKFLKSLALAGSLFSSTIFADKPVHSDPYIVGSTLDGKLSSGFVEWDFGKVSIEQTGPSQFVAYMGVNSFLGNVSLDINKSKFEIIHSHSKSGKPLCLEIKTISGSNTSQRNSCLSRKLDISSRSGGSEEAKILSSGFPGESGDLEDMLLREGISVLPIIGLTNLSNSAGVEVALDFPLSFAGFNSLVGVRAKPVFNMSGSSVECSESYFVLSSCFSDFEIGRKWSADTNPFYYLGSEVLPSEMGSEVVRGVSFNRGLSGCITFSGNKTYICNLDNPFIFYSGEIPVFQVIDLTKKRDDKLLIPQDQIVRDLKTGNRFFYSRSSKSLGDRVPARALPVFPKIEIPSDLFVIEGDSVRFNKYVPYVGEEDFPTEANSSLGVLNRKDGKPDFCFVYEGSYKNDMGSMMNPLTGKRQSNDGFRLSSADAYFLVDDDFVSKFGRDFSFFSNIYSDKYDEAPSNSLVRTQIEGVYAIKNIVNGGVVLRKQFKFTPCFCVSPIGKNNFQASYYGYLMSDFNAGKGPFFKQ